jgi:hypothetical protein
VGNPVKFGVRVDGQGLRQCLGNLVVRQADVPERMRVKIQQAAEGLSLQSCTRAGC